MKDHKTSNRQLSKGALCSVEQCACCGQLHVNIGALTLRLEPEAFSDIAGKLLEAQVKLEVWSGPKRALQS